MLSEKCFDTFENQELYNFRISALLQVNYFEVYFQYTVQTMLVYFEVTKHFLFQQTLGKLELKYWIQVSRKMWDWEKKTEMIVVNCVCDFNAPAPKERGMYCFAIPCLYVCVFVSVHMCVLNFCPQFFQILLIADA